MNLDAIKELLSGAETTAPVVPDAGTLVDKVLPIAKGLVVAGPVIMLILGLLYLFAAPKEANHHVGYRCYFGMGSEQAWRFTQRLAGLVLGGLGLVLTVVMYFVGLGFAGMEAMNMVWAAVRYLILEAVLALLANVAIAGLAAMRFDRRGEYRKREKKG